MTFFPSKVYGNQGDYARDYFSQLSQSVGTLDMAAVSRAGEMIAEVVNSSRNIFSCGNGGSAAIANHLVCDCLKGTRADTHIRPRVFSLSATVELVTAIGNDFGYEDIFSYQIESNAREGDLLIAISSSGSSPNIIKALGAARDLGMRSVALVGFSGGEAAKLADVAIWVQAQNYGIVEDIHQSVMHIFAQFLRQSNIEDTSLLGLRRF